MTSSNNSEGWAGSQRQSARSKFKYSKAGARVSTNSYQKDAKGVTQNNPLKSVWKFPTESSYGVASKSVADDHQINAKGKGVAIPKNTISSDALNVVSPVTASYIQKAAKLRRTKGKK